MSERSSRPSRSTRTPVSASEDDLLSATSGISIDDAIGATDGKATCTVPARDDSGRRVRGAILEALDETTAPVTIDEVVDRLVAGSDLEDELAAWSDLHERLYAVELPILDASGALEFDPERGLVDAPSSRRM